MGSYEILLKQTYSHQLHDWREYRKHGQHVAKDISAADQGGSPSPSPTAENRLPGAAAGSVVWDQKGDSAAGIARQGRASSKKSALLKLP